MDLICKASCSNYAVVYRLTLICLFVAHTACALKCHVCRNLVDANCLNVTSNKDDRFLRDCPEHSNSCGLEVTHVPYTKVYRDCVSKAWSCKNGCYLCDSDGCNYGTEIQETPKSPGVEVTPTELIQANIYGICGILLVAGLLLTFCILGCCSKGESEEYDEEGIEDDINEEYDFEYEETSEKSS